MVTKIKKKPKTAQKKKLLKQKNNQIIIVKMSLDSDFKKIMLLFVGLGNPTPR